MDNDQPPVSRDVLSPRELEVVEAVADGLTNSQIAALLYLEEGTVKSHLIHISDKLGTTNRTQVVAWAFRNGIVK